MSSGTARLAGADEDRILARFRTLRSDLIDPTIAVHHGRIVKRTGDGSIIEFRSVVDAVNCAIEVQRAMVERNAEVAPDKRIEFRMGILVSADVQVEESDGDLMRDGVNIAARLQSVAKPGAICLSEQAYWAGERAARLGGDRSRPDRVQEYRRADESLLAGGRRSGAGEARDQSQAATAEEGFIPVASLAAAVVALLILIAGGAWWLLNANRPGKRCHEVARRGRAAFHRGAAVR